MRPGKPISLGIAIALALVLICASASAESPTTQSSDTAEARVSELANETSDLPPPPPATQTLHPIRIIPIEPNQGLLAVSPDGSYAITISEWFYWDLWKVVVHSWPEIVLALGAILWLWASRKVWRRYVRPWRNALHRRTGEPHCAKCDYLLIGITSKECPECGASLANNGVRYGPRVTLRGYAFIGVCAFGLLVLPALAVWWRTTIPYNEYRPGELTVGPWWSMRAWRSEVSTAPHYFYHGVLHSRTPFVRNFRYGRFFA